MFTKKRRVFSRFLAIVMIISMISMGLPASVFASEQSGLAKTNETTYSNILKSPLNTTDVTPVDTIPTTSDTTTIKEKKILKELVDKREANVKHFLMDDMSEEADVYSAPVHYQVKGQWQEIDNSMVSASDDTVGNSLSNKSNDFKINIAKDTTSNKLVKIQKDKYEVSWNIENTKKSTAKAVGGNSDKELAKLSSEEKKKYVKNLDSNVTFSNVFQDVDLSYNIYLNNLKENIIIKKATDIKTFTFDLSTKNVVPQLTEDNSVVFYDKKEKSEVFTFEAPVMYDANGNTSKDISVKLSPKDNDYSLTITPNQEWLNDSSRVYPITIDPTVTPPTTFDKATVKEGSPDTIYDGDLEVGNNTNGQEMSYLQFNLPVLSAADTVTNSKLNLHSNSCTNSSQINLYKVKAKWTTSSITYTNQPTYNSIAEDYVKVTPDKQTASWDITRLTKDWYVNGNNNGVLLKSTNSTAGSGLTTFISTGSTGSLPSITIQYINNSGLESYWSYHSLNVGRAGTISTNDSNGNVIAVHDDLSLSGNRMPITLKHVYNSNSINDDDDDITIESGYGYGWKLNYDQTIIKTILSDTDPNADTDTYYVYTDQDGTKHYFPCVANIITMKDDSGLNLRLNRNKDKTYTIIDKNYNTWHFNADGKLTTMTDSIVIDPWLPISDEIESSNHKNKLNIGYNADGKITSISDGSGRAIDLGYDNTHHLVSITDLDKRTTSYDYNNSNQLTSITYPDKTITTYAYNADNTLKSVTNYDGHMATITYYTGGTIHRAKRVAESSSDASGTVGGESYDITYGDNSTSFVDAKGRIQKYQFNNSGNTTNIQNNDGSGHFVKYDTSTKALPNKIATQSKLQSSITNLMIDPSIERNNGTDWEGGIYGSDSTKETATIYSGTTYSHYGNKSLKLTNTDGGYGPHFDQSIALTKGKTYTFSAFVKTINVSDSNVSNPNSGAELRVAYQGNNGYVYAYSNEVNGRQDWQRVDLTFTLPSDAISNTVVVESVLCSETGTAYFDDFQLEAGEICNRYNLIENGEFSSYDTSNNPNYWTKSTYCTTKDIVTTDTVNHPTKLDNNVFKIIGDATKVKSISKKLFLNSSAGDIFVIGGWAKADSAPITGVSSRLFDIELQFDANSNKKKISFNPGCKDWQYVTDVITSPGFQQLTITINYSYNINSAMFDGIQFYKESYGKSYAYDDDGNLTSAVDLANQNKTFAYTNNDLTGYTDASGNHFSYFPDGSHNIEFATSGAGVKQEFTHDSYGNIKKITAGSSPSTASINTTATYTDSGGYVGNYVATITDALGNTISKHYNQNNGNLDSVIDAKNNTISYLYDTLGRVINTKSTSAVSTDSTNNTNANYVYENDRLKTISTNGVTYNFGYDPLGHNTSVSVGTQNLITNTYENTTGNLLSSTYGNGQTSEQDYDTLNRIVDQKYNGVVLFNYKYDDSGNLAYLQDIGNKVNYNYIYDFANRLVLVKDSTGNSIGNSTSYTYDKNNNVSTVIDTIRNSSKSASNVSYTTSYSYYDGDNRIKKMTTPATTDSPDGVAVTTEYDTNTDLGRIASKEIGNTYTTTYSYVAGSGAASGVGATSKVIASITNGTDKLSYTYDANGNIHTINDGTNTITYTYNALNELTREDNQVLNKSVVYAYDKGGNLLSKKTYAYQTGDLVGSPSTINYGYSDGNWKDKLTSYNNHPITYGTNDTNDTTGNPSTYNGYTYTWERGRELATLKGNGLAVSYEYNSNGIRTQKTVNGTTVNYHLVGDKVTFEDNGTDSIYYTYDPNGMLVSMNLNDKEYFYVRNAQSDIIGLVDKTGAAVASYVYDTWGKLVSIKDGSGTNVTNVTTSVGYKNPYRYRGYRYDTESGLYYCNSRYYNPDWGRFINADSLTGKVGVLLSHNLFAYCMNNPVNGIDPNGTDVGWAQSGNRQPYGLDHYSFGDYLTMGLTLLGLGLAAPEASEAGAALENVACFTEDTKVQTKVGHKLIKDIKVGDEVYSENPETGEKGLKKVKNVYIHESDTLVHLMIGNVEIKTTTTHPFWVVDKGWVVAGKLNVEDKLLLSSDEIVEIGAISNEQLRQPIKVYNFEVEDWHTYFVSDENILVHNSCLGFVNKTTSGFWKSYDKLPKSLQKIADEKFNLFLENPSHPGLNFEKLKGYTNRYSVRINDQYRAEGGLKDGVMTWDIIHPHTY